MYLFICLITRSAYLYLYTICSQDQTNIKDFCLNIVGEHKNLFDKFKRYMELTPITDNSMQTITILLKLGLISYIHPEYHNCAYLKYFANGGQMGQEIQKQYVQAIQQIFHSHSAHLISSDGHFIQKLQDFIYLIKAIHEDGKDIIKIFEYVTIYFCIYAT